MHLIRFKCKTTGRVFQEEEDAGHPSCSLCAFQWTKVQDGQPEVMSKHCLKVLCIPRCTHFVEVTA